MLGTHFNVKAYENESVINTTLLEGSIAISVSPIVRGRPASKQRVKSRVKSAGKINSEARSTGANTGRGEEAAGEWRTAKVYRCAKNNGPGKAIRVITVINSDVDKVVAWKNKRVRLQ